MEKGGPALGIVLDSPASESDLKPGDLICEINGTPASRLNENDLYLLFKKEGELFQLNVKRAEGIIKVSLKLRRLI